MGNQYVVEATTETFEQEVLQPKDVVVVVDFWATWCHPCLAAAPILEELAQLYEGKVKIVKVNVDENSELAQKYKVVSIPTFFFFKNGQLKDSTVGLRSKNAYKKLIDNILED